MQRLPLINFSRWEHSADERRRIASELGAACRMSGFFYVSGHGVDADLQERLYQWAAVFFALPEEEKMRIGMASGGRAWRGYFPPGGEQTSGRPDLKEGLYFGEDLPADDVRVRSGLPLHGPNLYPAFPPGAAELIRTYMKAMERLGQQVSEAVSASLGLPDCYIRDHLTAHPTMLFRIFHYPPSEPEAPGERWGVGEHTDYGLLTLLLQDRNGGLEVFSGDHWMDAPPVPGTYICNIGDMLERLTGGLYRSTPHRVRPSGAGGRLSFPFFFDPGFEARIQPLPVDPAKLRSHRSRWDGTDVVNYAGTYGDYLMAKVRKVFPHLTGHID